MNVGAEIRRAREAKGWSQAKLAAGADMGVSGISQIETGTRNPSVVTLSKIASALDVEVVDLFPKAQAPLPLDPLTEAERIEELRGFTKLLNGFSERWTEETEQYLTAKRGPFNWGLEKQSAALWLVQSIREIPSIGQRDEVEPGLSREEQQAKDALGAAVERIFWAAERAHTVQLQLEENADEIPESMKAHQRRYLTLLERPAS